jgi:hypothetical protein
MMGDPQLYVCVSGTMVKASPCECGALIFGSVALGAPNDPPASFDAEPVVATHEMVAGNDAVFSRPRTVYRRHTCPEESKP